jgi:hypothetical protein
MVVTGTQNKLTQGDHQYRPTTRLVSSAMEITDTRGVGLALLPKKKANTHVVSLQ